jgi:hypothetical protein
LGVGHYRFHGRLGNGKAAILADRHDEKTCPCRSEPARDEFKSTAVIQTTRVIVDIHRELARSHKEFSATKSSPIR